MCMNMEVTMRMEKAYVESRETKLASELHCTEKESRRAKDMEKHRE